MAITARDLANTCLAHINKGVDDTLPAGAKAYLVLCINRALEEMRREARFVFKRPIGIIWKAATTGTVTVTKYSRSITFGTLGTPLDGTSILIAGDSAYNEVAYDATAAASLLLLPFTGTSGTVSATAYNDSAVFSDTFDQVAGGHLAENGLPLVVLSSREEWSTWLSRLGRLDYGLHATMPNQARVTGVPRAVWVETLYPKAATAIAYRAHCAPMPDQDYRAILEVTGGPAPIVDTALDVADPAVYPSLPTPGTRETLLTDLVLYHWSSSPWFRNDSARPGIAAQYMTALDELRTFRGDSGQGFRMVPQY